MLKRRCRRIAGAFFVVSALACPAFGATAPVPYQQYVYTQNCPRGVPCTLDFDKVPGTSRLELKNVSCYVDMISTVDSGQASPAAPLRIPQIHTLQLLVKKGNTLVSASTLAPVTTVPDRTWGANHVVSVFAEGGERFHAVLTPSFEENLPIFFACHISGQMVKVP